MRLGLGLHLSPQTRPAMPIGGGWSRTDTSFLSGKTIKNVKADYGAVGNGIIGTAGSVTAASTAFTATGSAFVAGDVGKLIAIEGAGAANYLATGYQPHITTIAAYVSPTQVTLTVAATRTVSGVEYAYGTDDTTALQTAWAALANDWMLYHPTGIYLCQDRLTTPTGGRTGCGAYGDGPGLSSICMVKDAGHNASDATRRTQITLSNCSSSFWGHMELYAPFTTTRAITAGVTNGRGINGDTVTGFMTNFRVRGVAGAHVLFTKSSMQITYSTVKDGQADGFHTTGLGAVDNLVQYCVADNVGDDSFAAIGYGTSITTRTKFLDNIARNSKAGAGFSMEGATDGEIRRCVAYRTFGPGIRIGNKGGSINSGAVNGVTASDNVLTEVNQGSVADSGAISMPAGYSTVANVLCERNTITSPVDGKGVFSNSTAGTNVISGTAMTIQAVFNNNTMTGVTTGWTEDVEATLTGTGNTVNGAVLEP